MFVHRDLIEIKIPMKKELEIIHPENCLLVFCGTGISIDIGACCYTERDHQKRKAKAEFISRKVKLESYAPGRSTIIRKLISECLNGSFSDCRPSSLAYLIQYFVRFLQWNDTIGRCFRLEIIEEFSDALVEYEQFLVREVRLGKIKENTAAQYFQAVEKINFALLGQPREYKKKYKLKFNSKSTNSIEPAPINDQARVMVLCQMLFDQLFDLVVNEKKFPFWLSVPNYLNWPSSGTWLYPSKSWINPPIPHGKPNGRKNSAFNYEAGEFYSPEGLSKDDRTKLLKNRWAGEKKFIKANEDMRCSVRINLAMIAHNAFLTLFFSNSGANLSVVSDIEAPDSLELLQSSQGLRAVKFRAGGKEIIIEIPVSMIPRFNNFLNLRKFILGSLDYKLLFLALNPRNGYLPNKVGPGFIGTFYKVLSRITPEVAKINTRQWRASKADWSVRNYDIATAAQLLQNSEATLARNYVTGSAISQKNEVSDFFEFISKNVLFSNKKDHDLVVTPVGKCSNFGVPQIGLEGDASGFIPDCKKFEGCFGCVNHKVHADEVDVRKLISCRFCINSLRSLSVTQAQFDSLFGKVLLSIERIIKIICDVSVDMNHMVMEIEKQVVDDGLLDEFWKHHYEMLIAIGVLRNEI